MIYFTKDPDAKLDYAVDWSAWLEDGDTITASTWIVPEGLTASGQTVEGEKTVVWLAGGTAGQSYKVTNRVTTSAGRIDDRTLQVTVRER